MSKIDWLNEWKSMMCRNRLFNDYEDCIRPVEAFPCSECRFHHTTKDDKE